MRRSQEIIAWLEKWQEIHQDELKEKSKLKTVFTSTLKTLSCLVRGSAYVFGTVILGNILNWMRAGGSAFRASFTTFIPSTSMRNPEDVALLQQDRKQACDELIASLSKPRPLTQVDEKPITIQFMATTQPQSIETKFPEMATEAGDENIIEYRQASDPQKTIRINKEDSAYQEALEENLKP